MSLDPASAAALGTAIAGVVSGLTPEQKANLVLAWQTICIQLYASLSSDLSGSVDTGDIADGAITTAKIGNGQVTTAKIANGAVDTNQLAGGAVTTAKLANGAVGTNQLAGGAVTTSKIGTLSGLTFSSGEMTGVNRIDCVSGQNLTLADHTGAEVLAVRGTHTPIAMRSEKTYNNTTTSSPNLYMTSSGNIYRSTSSIRFKRDIEEAEASYYRKVLDLKPVFYRSKGTRDAELGWGYWGFIAEEVAEIDPRLVHWAIEEDDEGTSGFGKSVEDRKQNAEPNGVQYDRVAVLLQAVVKEHDEKINQIINRIEALEGASHEN